MAVNFDKHAPPPSPYSTFTGEEVMAKIKAEQENVAQNPRPQCATAAQYAEAAEPNAVQNILAQRGLTHGDFGHQAIMCESIKDAMKNSRNWCMLPPYMREALEMMAVKMSRILTGDPTTSDHWMDIAGYAQLVVRCSQRLGSIRAADMLGKAKERGPEV